MAEKNNTSENGYPQINEDEVNKEESSSTAEKVEQEKSGTSNGETKKNGETEKESSATSFAKNGGAQPPSTDNKNLDEVDFKKNKKYEKEQKKFEKEVKKQLKKQEKKEKPLTEKQKKRKENREKRKEMSKSIFARISNFFTKLRYFMLNGPIAYRKWMEKQARDAELALKNKSEKSKDIEASLNTRLVDIAKEKGYDAIVKDEKERQEKKIYFSKDGYDAYASINKYGQITEAKASVATIATKEDAEKIKSILQETRNGFTNAHDFNTLMCENFKKAGYEANIGKDGECVYISKGDKNFIVEDFSRPNPEIYTQTITNTLDIKQTLSELSKEVRENAEKTLSEELGCKVKIGENEKGIFIEVEEKENGKYSMEEIKDYLKTEEKIDISANGKDYQLQSKDGNLVLVEYDGEKEKAYTDEKEVAEKLKEIGILADKQVVQIDKNGNLEFTQDQLNNDLCKKLEDATMVMSSFQEHSEAEEKKIRNQKQIETTIKNVQGLKPNQTFEREQDGFFIKATCGEDGVCVVNVKGKADSSEEVSLSGSPKDITAKLEEALVKASTEIDVSDAGDLNRDGSRSFEKDAIDDLFDEARAGIEDSTDSAAMSAKTEDIEY